MTSTGVNVLRWSALFAGLLYGISHQSTLRAQQRENEAKRKYHEQENLISKAKAEYVKKTKPQEAFTAGGDVISDPNDPNFDLEAYLTMKAAAEK